MWQELRLVLNWWELQMPKYLKEGKENKSFWDTFQARAEASAAKVFPIFP